MRYSLFYRVRDTTPQARAVLRDLPERREKLEVAIAKQRQKVAVLAVLDDQGGDDMSPELNLGGLTNACGPP
jgi:hypothetical protein